MVSKPSWRLIRVSPRLQLRGSAAGGLTKGEKSNLFGAGAAKIAATPLVAALGLASTSITIAYVGSGRFGVISLIATSLALFPFADFGVGAAVTTASAGISRSHNSKLNFLNVVTASVRALRWVSLVIVLISVFIGAAGQWGGVFGVALTYREGWVISSLYALFALSIPLGLGSRVLIGIGRNYIVGLLTPVATLISFMAVFLIWKANAPSILLVLPSMVAVTIVNLGSVLLARRALVRSGFQQSGLTFKVWGRRPPGGLLAGSLWMLLIMVTQPLTLQTGRMFLSHLSDADQLAQYAVLMQLYAAGWGALSLAGMALWPAFVARRGDRGATLQVWLRSSVVLTLVAAFGAVVFFFAAPPVSDFISGGQIDLDRPALVAFMLLLLVQAAHLPTGMLLTRPDELRWQSMCTVVASVIAVVGSILTAASFGVAGVVGSAAAGVLVGQLVPDLVFVRTLISRRFVGSNAVSL